MLSVRLRRAAAIGLVSLGCGLGAAPAFADNPSHHGRPKPWPACPHGHPRSNYPPHSCAAETDRDSVAQGGRFSVFGLGFRPGEQVVVAMPQVDADLATLPANADGAVLTSVAIPATVPLGRQVVTLTAASGNEVVGAITVMKTEAASSHRDLPFAGAAAAIPLAAAGVMMVASGSVVMALVRRRRRLLLGE